MLRTLGRFVLRVAGLLSLRLAGCGGASQCVRVCLRARARAHRPGAAGLLSRRGGSARAGASLAAAAGAPPQTCGGRRPPSRLPRLAIGGQRLPRACRARCPRPAVAAGPGRAFALGPRPGEPHAAPAPAAAAARLPGCPGQVQDRSRSTQRLSARAPECPSAGGGMPRVA